MSLRQRRRTLNKVVQDLDAFPKIPEPYIEQTTSGASIALITFFLVLFLIYSELQYFMNPGFNFKFVPDADFEEKLKINIDLTVAMPCDSIGADILDSTNQNTFSFGRLKEENEWFQLDRLQRQHFEAIQTFNDYLREENHALQDLMWRSGKSALYGDIPERRQVPTEDPDACRVHGSLTLNKVAGNFHVTAGKSVPLMRGHAHLSPFMSQEEYNFTHRINKFSFGSPHGGIVQPLEGDEKIAAKNMMSYQYFIQVVPTDIQSLTGTTHTYQYSVKELAREIDHGSGSHGVPGIYFKYDMSALKVIVTEDRESFITFLVRLCAGVGGLVATSQIVCGLLQSAIWFVFCRGKPEVGTKPAKQPSQVKPTGLIPPPQKSQDQNAKFPVAGVTLEEVEQLINGKK